ncbi:hypothetical protein [Collimonas arenae]|uniref:hypothetical protein n=1 Tax=Collimonas arenae TaxID=279058 RepID=UPI00056E1BD0|nr:hypothetical protein [Collimonas arenae]
MSKFYEIIEEHRTHCKKWIGRPRGFSFVPSAKLAAHFYFLQRDKSSPSAKKNYLLMSLEINAQDSVRAAVNSIQMMVEDATVKLHQNDAHQTELAVFRNSMQRIHERVQGDLTVVIDMLYDEAASLGTAHPGVQSDIVDLLDRIGAYVTDLILNLTAFIVQIVNDVVAWLPNAWTSIRNTFNALKTWIEGWFYPGE